MAVANRPISTTTVKRYYACLRYFWNWLISEGYCESNPVLRIKPPKEAKPLIRGLSAEEIDKLITACSGKSFEDIRNQALLMVFIDTGLRLSEVTNITLEVVDLERQTITVWGKGARQRIVRFGLRTAKSLWRYLKLRNSLDGASNALWLTKQGETLQGRSIETLIQRLGKVAGVEVHPHQLRHSFALQMLKNGSGVFETQYLLGHSSLEMTKRYVQTLGFDEAYAAHSKYSPMDCLKAKLSR